MQKEEWRGILRLGWKKVWRVRPYEPLVGVDKLESEPEQHNKSQRVRAAGLAEGVVGQNRIQGFRWWLTDKLHSRNVYDCFLPCSRGLWITCIIEVIGTTVAEFYRGYSTGVQVIVLLLVQSVSTFQFSFVRTTPNVQFYLDCILLFVRVIHNKREWQLAFVSSSCLYSAGRYKHEYGYRSLTIVVKVAFF